MGTWDLEGQLEAQVTRAFEWLLKWRAVLCDRALYMWDLVLSPGGQCQNEAEFSDSPLVSENCLLVWANLPTQTGTGARNTF